MCVNFVFFFSSRRRHTRLQGDWSSDVCSSDLLDDLDGLRVGIAGHHETVALAFDGALGQRHGLGGRDRKSTRLNSSHLVISYAVFCLKKKNKALLRIQLESNIASASVTHILISHPH